MGRECSKVCDYGTYINLLEMHFSRDELKVVEEAAAPTTPERFKHSKKNDVKQFLANNNIKSRFNINSKKVEAIKKK